MSLNKSKSVQEMVTQATAGGRRQKVEGGDRRAWWHVNRYAETLYVADPDKPPRNEEGENCREMAIWFDRLTEQTMQEAAAVERQQSRLRTTGRPEADINMKNFLGWRAQELKKAAKVFFAKANEWSDRSKRSFAGKEWDGGMRPAVKVLKIGRQDREEADDMLELTYALFLPPAPLRQGDMNTAKLLPLEGNAVELRLKVGDDPQMCEGILRFDTLLPIERWAIDSFHTFRVPLRIRSEAANIDNVVVDQVRGIDSLGHDDSDEDIKRFVHKIVMPKIEQTE